MTEKEQILEYLEFMAEMVPAPFYWVNLETKFMGINDWGLKAIGAISKNDVIGKTPYELYKNEDIANVLQEDVAQVIKTGRISIKEDKIVDVTTGQSRYFKATRAPLRNKDGKIIGIIGASIEITAEKEAAQLRHDKRKLEAQNEMNKIMLERETEKAERLRLENEVHQLESEKHKAVAAEQANFKKIADRVAHDLRPPVSSIAFISKHAPTLPESQRITLRDAANSINDLAESLLSYYKPKVEEADTDLYNNRVPLLVAGAITEILSQTRLQHPNLPVTFIDKISQDSYFVFILAPLAEFKSMLINLMNNSVDAMGGKTGTITVYLECEKDTVKITIQDNGKGMSPELVNKIMNNEAVTEGKKGGHGIGMTQVRDALKHNEGKFIIKSAPGVGTKIILSFPKILPPAWVAEQVVFNNDDVIVVLDDDPSIHGSWDSRFLLSASNLEIKHFKLALDAIEFINAASPKERQKIFLLTDYELLEQGSTGLDVIHQTGISRSILVTSLYENKQVQEQAQKTNTKILPKLLALEIPISVAGTRNKQILENISSDELLHVDLLIIDDNRPLTDNLKNNVLAGKNIAVYNDVHSFLANIYKYPRDTKILLDNNFDNYMGDIPNIGMGNTGFHLARKLHEEGYTNLYLFSGDKFDSLPSYLKVVAKHHFDDIEALLNLNPAPQSEELVKAEIFREVIVNFVYTNCREQRNALADNNKSAAEQVRHQLEDECVIISRAERIFNGRTKNPELMLCDLKDNLNDYTLQYILKNNIDMLDNQEEYAYFKYLGNRLILDLVLTLILRYAVHQVKQHNSNGGIRINTVASTGYNKLFIQYKTVTVEVKPEEPLLLSHKDTASHFDYLTFCGHIMSLLGGKLSISSKPDNCKEFILSFPHMN